MAKVAFTNTKKHAVHVGPVTIMSGGTREVEETHLDDYKAETPEKTVEASEVLDQLDQSIPNFTAAIQARDEDGAPVITDAELDELEQAENNGKTRSGVLSAITDERLIRSQAAMLAEELGEYRASIADMDEESLMEEMEAQKDDLNRLNIVSEVIESLSNPE